jgi:DNA-binding PadR family transcriptional regulator
MPRAARSELECFVIGLVWQLGPSSPYDVRRHMLASPSTQWSASAGAIYPLMRRLDNEGLLRSEPAARGRRARRLYSTTPAGLRALRAWIGPPLRPDVVTVSHDPLRSRARFLAALTPAQRRRWLDSARRALDELEQRILAWEASEPHTDPFAAHMTRCGTLDLDARRTWLRELRAAPEGGAGVRAVSVLGPQRTRSGSGNSR